MIEQKLEKKLVDKIKSVIEDTGVQVIGTIQPEIYGIKSEEKDYTKGCIVVKVAPRTYDTPTIPTAKFVCALSMSIRADIDYNGNTYLDLCDKIMTEMENLQKCKIETHEYYNLPDDGFCVTGFQLTDGDFATDTDNKIWQYTNSFTIFGIIN